MIRPLTLLCLTAAAGAGLYLYQVKHQVALLDRELREIRRATEQAQERTAVLRAEWALLNEPERLRRVATHYLSLEPMLPQQFVRLSELDRRLPPAQAFAGAPSLFDPPPAPAAPPTMLAASAVPEPPAPRAPAAPAVAARPPAPAPRPAAAPAPRQAAPEPAAARPEPAPRPASPQRPSIVASAVAAPARGTPHRAPARPQSTSEALARIARGGPVDLNEPAIASALGAVRPALAPPVPVSAAATLR